jgi:hypothetical protein
MASPGWLAYRRASASASRTAARRYAGALGQYVSRLPWVSRTPSAVTGNASGWAWVNQGGGDAVGVASAARTPFSYSRSSARSSQSNRYSPSAGSSRDQANTPSDTRLTPASRISATSSRHTDSGHCSGL